MYYYDCHVARGDIELLNTVEGNSEGFTTHKVARKILVRRVYNMVGLPPQKYFNNMVRSNLIHNFPVTVADIIIADKIFGPDIGSLRGNMVRRALDPVRTNYVAIPDEIQERIGDIEIMADLFFVIKIQVLITLGKHVKFTTIANIPNCQAATLLTGINAVENMYKQRGYYI